MSINLSSNFLLSAGLPLDAKSVAANISARNAIPAIQRYEGLKVYVLSGTMGGPQEWQLQGGILDANWVLVGGSVAAMGTVVERYIDPAGSNSNSGIAAGPSTAWLTPTYAIKQCQQMGPGKYRIHVAVGLYNSVDIDVPPVINWTAESAGTETVIEYVGDETTPTTTTFQNTVGSICYHSAPGVSIRFAGIYFRGSGSNTGILHSAGTMYFRNCKSLDHYIFYRGLNFGTRCVVEQPLDMQNTYYGFGVLDGAFLQKNANVSMTPPATLSLSTDPVLFSAYNAQISLSAGTSEIKSRPGLHLIVGHGWLIDGYNSTIDLGSFTELLGAELKGLWRTDGCRILTGNPNTFHLTGSDGWFEMTESFFQDRSGNTWLSDSLPPDGIKLGIGAKFISPNVASHGTPPITFFDDYMTEYVQYIGPDNYLASADDDRYTEKFCGRIFGEVPKGYTLADIGPSGVLDAPEYIFIATENCEIVDFRIITDVGNGGGNTDTYFVAVDGAFTALSVVLTNTTNNFSTNKLRLVAGNKVSLKLTSAAGTVAQNITYQLTVRRYR